jgi:hypothetical protein
VDDASGIQATLAVDSVRWRLLKFVQSLALPDCWIGAGFMTIADNPHRIELLQSLQTPSNKMTVS